MRLRARDLLRILPGLAGLAMLLSSPAGARAAGIPPDMEHAKAQLNASPRHGEWADLKDGNDTISAWVVYPERPDKAPVVVIVHTIAGLTDWVRAVADQLASEGFIAVAPDLLSGKGPGGTNTPAERDAAAALARALDPAEVMRRLSAVAEYGISLPAAAGEVGCIGYCWGGGICFDMATELRNLDAAVVYYGRSPSIGSLQRIQAPVLGLYGANDARINETIPPAEAELNRLGKSFEKHIYEGAGHGFLERQGGQDGANLKASQQAWPRTILFLRQNLEQSESH
jgi:carboxymethylenebutenolidase